MVHISERESDMPDAMIGRLLKVAIEDKSIISLGPGEPDFPAPKPIVSYTKKIADKCNHYSPPGGLKELKESVVKKLEKENKIKTETEKVVITSGSQEGLLLAIASSMDVSEQVIIPNPSFLAYLPCAELFNVQPIFVKLEEEDKWEINPDAIKERIDDKKTKAILINTPSNPTGNVLNRKTLEELADISVEYNIYIFSDEAYEKITYGKKHVSVGSLNGMEDYVATFQSFSKTYAMAGYRIGYVNAPLELAKAITKVHVYSTIAAPTISQLLAIKALSLSRKYTQNMVKEYKRRRELILKRLDELNLKTIKPEGAFYAFSNIKHLSDNSLNFVKTLIKEAKVAAVPGIEFGRYGEGYLRFSYATDYKLIDEAMNRLEKFLKKTEQ